MADSSVIGSLFLDLDKIKAKLGEISSQEITININSQEVLNSINGIRKQLNSLVNGNYDIKLNIDTDNNAAKSIKGMVDNLTESIGGIGKTIREEFQSLSKNGGINFQNVFNYSASKMVSQTKSLSLYKEEAKELLSIVTQLRDMSSSGLNSLLKGASAKGNGGESFTDKLFRLVNVGKGNDKGTFDETKFIGKISGAESTTTIKKIIGELQYYKQMAEEVNKLAGNPLAFDKIDTKRLEEIEAQLNSGVDQAKKIEQAFTGATQGVTQGTQAATTGIGDKAKEAQDATAKIGEVSEESFKKVSTLVEEIGNSFDALKEKIDNAFGFEKAFENITSLKEQIGAIGTELNDVKAATDAISQIQEKVKQAKESQGKTGQPTGLDLKATQITGDTKYINELEEAIKRYGDAFADANAKVNSIRISTDALNDSQTAVVKFSDALGNLTSMSFKYGENGWEKIGETFSQTFKEGNKDIEKTLDVLQKFQNQLNTIQSKGFERKNQLSGDYAKPVTDGIKEAQSAIDSFLAKAKSVDSPLAMTSEQVRELKQQLADLDQLRIKQQDSQYQARQLSATDITNQIPVMKNDIAIMESKLNNMGFGEKFASQIQELRDLLKTMGTEGGATVQQFNSQMKQLKSDVSKYETTAQGQGLKLGLNIEQNQLTQIDSLLNTLNNLPSSISGTGVQAAIQELNQLSAEYKEVVSQLQSENLNQDQFDQLGNKAKELEERFKQVASAAKMFQDGFKNEQDLAKYQSNVDKLRANFEKLERTYGNLIASNPEIAAKFEAIRNALSAGKIDPINFAQIAKDVSTLGAQCSNAAGQTAGLRGALESAFGGFGSYLARFTSSFYIITKAIRTVKSMVNEVKALDTSLMELQKVTNLSGESLAQFTNKAYSMGKEVGRTGKDVIDAVTTFSRAGYDLNEATQLAQSALVMTNVGVDINSTEDAASDMISILKAFDKQANESMEVIDKLYSVANKEPLDFGNITQMLVTAGGTLAQTGTSLEETMGLVTGGFATLRDESVANGLIMISQRLRGVKEDGEAIEEAGFMPKLKKAFGDVGVAIEDDNGELRSTYDILNDLAGVWDNLSSKQRQFLGEKAAGNRQVKTLNAIMMNWDVVQDTIQKANEATGEGMKGNEKYLDSIEGRITQLKSAFSDMARTTIDSGFVKGIVSIGTAALTLTKNIGGLVPILTTITGIIVTLKGEKIAEGIKGIGVAIKGIFAGGASLASVASIVGIVITAISAIAIVVNGIKSAQKSLSELSSESRQSYTEQKDKVQSLNEELENTQEKMKELAAMGSLTVVQQDEYDRLRETNDQLERQLALEKARLKIKEREARENAAKATQEYNERTTEGKGITKKTIGVSEGLRKTLGTKYFEDNIDKSHIRDHYMRFAPSVEELVKAHSEALLIEKKNAIEANKKYYEALAEARDENGEIKPEEVERLDALAEANETAQTYVNESEEYLLNYVEFLDEQIAGHSFVEDALPGSLDEYFNNMIEQRDKINKLLTMSSMVGASKGDQFSTVTSFYSSEAKELEKAVSTAGKKWNVDGLIGELEKIDNYQVHQTLGDILEQQFNTGNTDVLNRPIVSGQDMLNAGWMDFKGNEDSIATYYSSVLSDTVGNIPVAVSITPITPDGKVLSPQEMDDYFADLVGKSGSVEELFANDKAGKQLLLHYTPVIDGNWDAAADVEAAFGQLLHIIDGAFEEGKQEGGLSVSKYLQGMFEQAANDPANADAIYTEIFTLVNYVADKMAASGDTTLKDAINDMFAANGYGEIFSNLSTLGWSVSDIWNTVVDTFASSEDVLPKIISSLEQLVSEGFRASESYKNLTTAMSEQEKAGVITFETYQKLVDDKEGLPGIAKCLELTAEGFALNTEALQDYIKAKVADDKINAIRNLLDLQDALNATIEAREGLTGAELAQNYDQEEQLRKEIDALQAYIHSLDAATGALNRYKAAKKTPNDDEDYLTGQGALKDVKEGWKSGKIGSDDYQEAMGFFLGSDWKDQYGNGKGAYKAATKVGDRYFKDEKKGAGNFLKDLQKAGLAEEIDGNLQLKEGLTLDAVAQGLADVTGNAKMSEDAVASLFKLLQIYSGDDFEWPEFVTPDEAKRAQELADQEEIAAQKRQEANDAQKEYQRILEENGGDENNADVQAAKEKAEAAEKLAQAEEKALEVLKGDNLEGEVGKVDALQEMLDKYNELKTLMDEGVELSVTLTGQYTELESILEQLGIIPPKQEKETEFTGDSTGVEEAAQSATETVDAFGQEVAPDPVPLKAEDETENAYKSATENVYAFGQEVAPDPIPLEAEDKANEPAEEAIAAVNNYSDNADSVDTAELKAEDDTATGIDAANTSIQNNFENGGPHPATISVQLDNPSVEAAKSVLASLTNPEPKKITVQLLDDNGDPVGAPEEREMEVYDTTTDHGNYTSGYLGTLPYPKRPPVVDDTPSQDWQNDTTINKWDIELTAETMASDNSGQTVAEEVQGQLDAQPPVEIKVKTKPEENDPSANDPVGDLAGSGADVPLSLDTSEAEDDFIVFESDLKDNEIVVPLKVQPEEDDPLNSGDMQSLGSHVGDMVGAGLGKGAEAEVNALTDAYNELSNAQFKIQNVEPADTSGYEAAASELSGAATTFNEAYKKLSEKLGNVPDVKVDADTSKALKKIKDLTKDRTTTVTVKYETQGTPPEGLATGTKNAPQGPSLVDEKGAELIEHTNRGTYELGTNQGPRMAYLDKGDVVHTATETKKILSRMSKIGGFFRDGLNKGKSIIGGAFARGISGSISLANIKRVIGSSRKKIKGTDSSSSSSSSSSKKTKTSAKKFQDWAAKLFDWAEIRLERLKTVTNGWLLSAAEAIGYIAKNKELNGAIAAVEDEIEATTKAYDLYIKQADAVAKKGKLSADIVKKIQQGDISIKSYKKATQEKIQEYQKWYEKALACSDALNDLREQEKELAKQKLDNIIQHYDNRIKRLDNIVKHRNAEIELATAMGRELQAGDYATSIDKTTEKLQNLIDERDALAEEFYELVSEGLIEKESDDWFEYKEKLHEVDIEIVNVKNDVIDLNDTVNKLNITKLGWQLDKLTNSASRMSEMMDLHDAQGIDEEADAYKELIDNGMEQIKILEEQNEEYRRQQEGLDELSEKYQELEDNIQSNLGAINSMKTSQEEWNDSVLDLKINMLDKFRDSLQKTNDAYQRQKELREAIEELQRAQDQRTVKTYVEGEGFVFQADQDAIKDAQENLENVIENQLLGKIDDLVEALEDLKNDTNIYDAEGNLLGTAYTLPQLGNLSEILENYYSSGSTPGFSGLKESLYDQIIAGATNSNTTQFNFGDINLSEVNDVETLGRAIIDLLPNAILQSLNKKY